jgi:hypothetical protein
MRKHIGRAIARRSAAVHTALNNYNALAPLQQPPQPILEYNAVATYGWLGEFELLKESRHDVLHKPWANSANREVAAKFYKIVCAREELVRLNVEIRRLQTWLDDEDSLLISTADRLQETKPLLGAAI